jgi:hypothetical protein
LAMHGRDVLDREQDLLGCHAVRAGVLVRGGDLLVAEQVGDADEVAAFRPLRRARVSECVFRPS